MRVLISGATGFIGVALCREMINNGHDVTVIIRENSTKKEKLPKEVKIIELSLERLHELNGNYDVMYHLAWNGSSGSDRNDFEKQYSNIKYTAEAIKAAKRCGCTKFIGAGSQAEYGVVHKVAKEDETVCKPFMMYGAAKLAAYSMGKIVAEQEDISFVWPRIYSVYGVGENEGTLMSYLVNTLLEGKVPDLSPCENMWNFMYIDDCACVLRSLGEKDSTQGIYNVASDDTRLLKDFVMEVRDIVNPKLKLNFGAKSSCASKTFWLDPSIDKIRELKYDVKVSFEDGIKLKIKEKELNYNEKK